ncbi:MAG: carboxypeptidase M32 [Clostridia bacterium]|nr:carboxypeptidase M32 [Clostridia bacterium]
MTIEQARQDLLKLQEQMSAYNHAMGLISYDGETTAPKGTAANRAHALGILSEITYKLSTGKETVELLEFLDSRKDELTDKEKRMVYLLLKDIRFMQKIPMEEYVEYQKLTVESQDVWYNAKLNSDFDSFEPYLEKMFDFQKCFAHYAAPDMDPYDYWLNEYEPGLSKEKCDAFFAALRQRLVPLIHACGQKPQVSDACLKGDFPEDKQEALALWLMETMGLDMGHVGLSTTEHPFTTGLGSHLDERITTHYQRDDVSSSLFSVVHEGGHALYDTGSDEDLAYTVLDGGVSMGIHESQSRFYENILARSPAFIRFLFPKLQELFPEQMKGYAWQDFYKAVNRVRPSLIRTEADEVTYSLHVMIRYELEKKVMAGEMTVHELPRAWNRLYQEYLGVTVPDDRRGVLQDSHWSFGAIGYFPSYALGSAYGAQFLVKMREAVDVDADLEKGDFSKINEWNRAHIWRFGSSITPQQILDRTLEAPFDPSYYLDYLERKCKDIYGV